MISAARRLPAAAALLAAVTLAFGPGAEPLPVDFVDLSAHPTVRIVVRPPEAARAVPITAAMVTVRESGETQPAEVVPLGTEPIVAVLAVDVSGSMEGEPLEAAKAAALGFVERVPDGSSIALVAFGTEIQVVADFDADPDELRSAIDGLQLAGNTSLYDAVVESARLIDGRDELRRFVVLLSDGGDTTSAASRQQALAALTPLDIALYVVELEGFGLDSEALAAIAEAGGGEVIRADTPDDLGPVYDAIAADVVSQYGVDYTATRGGAVLLEVEIAVDGVTYVASLTVRLPTPPATTTLATAPTLPTVTVPERPGVAAPPIAVAPRPSPLYRAWTLAAGAAAMFVATAIVAAYALRPTEPGLRSRRSVLDDEHEYRGGLLSRVSTGLTRQAETLFARSGRARGLSRTLEAAGVALRPGEFSLIVALAVFTAFVVGAILSDVTMGLLLGAAAALAPRLILANRATKRRRAFADQLDGDLQLLAGSLRAGYGLTQALDAVAADAPSPSSDEFGRVVVETRLGRDLTDALIALSRRMDNPDLKWVAEAVGIQREVGGDLSEVLDTVAATIRERNQIRRQVQALSAEGRISAVILVGLPILLTVAISVLNPGYLNELTGSTVGRMLLIMGAVLMVIGIIWLRRIVRIVF